MSRTCGWSDDGSVLGPHQRGLVGTVPPRVRRHCQPNVEENQQHSSLGLFLLQSRRSAF
jgi:hypothetical protein